MHHGVKKVFQAFTQVQNFIARVNFKHVLFFVLDSMLIKGIW
jgi:hypothetical protein